MDTENYFEELTGDTLTVKQYAEKLNVSTQTIYDKMKRLGNNLNGHIYKKSGVTYLDTDAQEMIKPKGGNTMLIAKVAAVEKELEKSKERVRELSRDYEGLKINNNSLSYQFSSATEKVSDLRNELKAANEKISELEQRINSVTDKAMDVEKLQNRLTLLFDVLEESANKGVGKVIGNLLKK